MKKYFFYATVAIAMLAGCRKSEPVPVTPTPDDAQVAIELGADATMFTVTKTKAAVERWNNTDVYVYAIDNAGTALINNYHTQVDANGRLNIYSNADYDGGNLAQGATKAAPYFYGEDKIYSFYGYHVGDAVAAPVPTAAAGVYTLPVTFTGKEDIMFATTDKEKDIDGKNDVTVADVYSAWSARREVVPNLKFNHALTRFNFIVRGKNQKSTSVTVTGISLESVAEGTLTVVSPDATDLGFVATADAQPTTLTLKNEDDTDYRPQPVQFEGVEKQFVAGGDHACIMFNPGMTSVPVKVEMVNNVYDNSVIPAYEFDVKAAEVKKTGTPDNAAVTEFEAGNAYTVYINVYGPEEIVVTAELTPWVTGGDFTYDPDEVRPSEKVFSATASLTATTDESLTYSIRTSDAVTAMQANLSESTTAPAADDEGWADVVATKVQDWTVTFDGLATEKTYYLYLRYKTDDAATTWTDNTAAVAESVPGQAIQSLTLALVYDKATYNSELWESYTQAYPYYQHSHEINNFPWLVFRIKEIPEEGKNYTVKFYEVPATGEPVELVVNAEDFKNWNGVTVENNGLTIVSGTFSEGIMLDGAALTTTIDVKKTYKVVVNRDGEEYVATTVSTPVEPEEGETEEPAAPAFDVTKSYVVVNTPESWAQMPASYLERFPWADDLLTNPENAHLPYLAAEFTPVKTLNVVVKDAEGNDLWTKSYTKENEFSFLTISNREDELNGQLVSSDYTVILTSNEVSEEVILDGLMFGHATINEKTSNSIFIHVFSTWYDFWN